MTEAMRYNRDMLGLDKLSVAQITELVKFWQAGHGCRVDGFADELTRGTIDAILASERAPEDNEWVPWDGPMDVQPTNRGEIYEIFGNPGSATLSKKWKRKNIVGLSQSEGNLLPGAPAWQWVSIHKLVEPYLREALRRACAACPDYVIERIGSFNFRHLRHDPKRPLSTHSWGISVDINPEDNFAKTFERGKGPRAWSPEYMEIWPNGLPEAFVRAFQSCGFAWGSDWDEDGDSHDHTFYDPMHFEWVARNGESLLV